MKLKKIALPNNIHWFFKIILAFLILFLSWSLFYFGLPRILPTQRVESGEVYGIILSDQLWGGEIKIIGDIYSPTDSKVTILPGTIIRVEIENDKSNFDLYPWHWKSGVNTGEFNKGVRTGEPFWDEKKKIQIHLNRVIINGNPSNPVIINSNSQNPSPFDFNVIRIREGFITNAIFSNYRRFEIDGNLTILNSTFKDTGECSLCITKSNPLIENNIFENSQRESIWIDRGSPQIHSNLFLNLIGDGIVIDSKRQSIPLITNNVFEMPQRTALNIISGGQIHEGSIARNIFAGNTNIKIACDTKAKIRDNVIFGLISFTHGCDGGFTFGPNFWGPLDPKTVMKEKILSRDEKFQVQIPTVLIAPPKEAGRK